MEAIESFIIALGGARLFMYTSAGLFHPARKVREIFWKIHNSIHISAYESLVSVQPIMDDGSRLPHHDIMI
jgi:splicing factor 3B subunit 1